MSSRLFYFVLLGLTCSGCSAISPGKSNGFALSQTIKWENYSKEELNLIEFINEISEQSNRHIKAIYKQLPDLIEVQTGLNDSTITTHYSIKKRPNGELVLVDIKTSQS